MSNPFGTPVGIVPGIRQATDTITPGQSSADSAFAQAQASAAGGTPAPASDISQTVAPLVERSTRAGSFQGGPARSLSEGFERLPIEVTQRYANQYVVLFQG
ncbi:MAG: hypothetical protein EA385_10725 [Salinarimonadaceae bacterium]|nr:MAG: hypothetical protein EA385_10725 [Salinarimonadaceae bacterium]